MRKTLLSNKREDLKVWPAVFHVMLSIIIFLIIIICIVYIKIAQTGSSYSNIKEQFIKTEEDFETTKSALNHAMQVYDETIKKTEILKRDIEYSELELEKSERALRIHDAYIEENNIKLQELYDFLNSKEVFLKTKINTILESTENLYYEDNNKIVCRELFSSSDKSWIFDLEKSKEIAEFIKMIFLDNDLLIDKIYLEVSYEIPNEILNDFYNEVLDNENIDNKEKIKLLKVNDENNIVNIVVSFDDSIYLHVVENYLADIEETLNK